MGFNKGRNKNMEKITLEIHKYGIEYIQKFLQWVNI